MLNTVNLLLFSHNSIAACTCTYIILDYIDLHANLYEDDEDDLVTILYKLFTSCSLVR